MNKEKQEEKKMIEFVRAHTYTHFLKIDIGMRKQRKKIRWDQEIEQNVMLSIPECKIFDFMESPTNGKKIKTIEVKCCSKWKTLIIFITTRLGFSYIHVYFFSVSKLSYTLSLIPFRQRCFIIFSTSIVSTFLWLKRNI